MSARDIWECFHAGFIVITEIKAQKKKEYKY